MNDVSTNRWADFSLQVLFILGLIGLVLIFYFTRISTLQAGDKDNGLINGENFQTAYEFEQEELNIEGRIRVLKVDYANDVVVYQAQLLKISNSKDYSELEKKEKLKILNDLYSDSYFSRKEGLIDQENLKLENLKRLECQRFCTIDDLNRASASSVDASAQQ